MLNDDKFLFLQTNLTTLNPTKFSIFLYLISCGFGTTSRVFICYFHLFPASPPIFNSLPLLFPDTSSAVIPSQYRLPLLCLPSSPELKAFIANLSPVIRNALPTLSAVNQFPSQRFIHRNMCIQLHRHLPIALPDISV